MHATEGEQYTGGDSSLARRGRLAMHWSRVLQFAVLRFAADKGQVMLKSALRMPPVAVRLHNSS